MSSIAHSRTQSALLEAMGEGYVTVDSNISLSRNRSFFRRSEPSDHWERTRSGIAARSFAVKLALDYPAEDKERNLTLATFDRSKACPNRFFPQHFDELQASVETVFISEGIVIR